MGLASAYIRAWFAWDRIHPFSYREGTMKSTMKSGCRAKVRRCPPSYRPHLEFLEDRLPLGDALLGALLGSSLIAPKLLASLVVLDNTAGKLPEQGSIAPWFAEPANQNAAVVRLPFLDDALGTSNRDSIASHRNSEIAAEPARLVPPDWAMLTDITNSSARLMPLDLGASGAAYLGQTAGASFFGIQTSDARLAAPLGVLTQPRSPGMISATAAHPSTVSAPTKNSSPANASQLRQNYGQLPLSFEANVGQADPSVQFLTHGPGYGLYLTGSEAVMVVSPQQESAVGQAFQPDGIGQAGKPAL